MYVYGTYVHGTGIESMESVIEQQRKLHEERERLEDAIVKEKTLKKATVSCIPVL